MALYKYDPNKQTTGVNPLGNGWTLKAINSPNDSAIAEVTTPIGTKAWQYAYITSSLAPAMYTLDAIPETVDTCEILSLARFSGGTEIPSLGVMSRVTGNPSPQPWMAGYIMRIADATDAVSTRMTDNNPNASVSSAAHGLTYASGTWFWIKMSSSSSTHRARFWEYGTTEPGTWLLERSDATYQSGTCGICDWLSVNSGVSQLAWFGVGTGADSAPHPADEISGTLTPIIYYQNLLRG